jgi:hypothetical protein
MKRLTTYPWRSIYVSAILETDVNRITGRIYDAIGAMEHRSLEPSTIDDDESRALAHAEIGIQNLITERAEKPE